MSNPTANLRVQIAAKALLESVCRTPIGKDDHVMAVGEQELRELREAVNSPDLHPQAAEVRDLCRRLRERQLACKGVDYMDGEFAHISNFDRAATEILNLDEAILVVETMTRTCKIHVVLGNDPGDLVVNYSTDTQLHDVVGEHQSYWERRRTPPSAGAGA